MSVDTGDAMIPTRVIGIVGFPILGSQQPEEGLLSSIEPPFLIPFVVSKISELKAISNDSAFKSVT